MRFWPTARPGRCPTNTSITQSTGRPGPRNGARRMRQASSAWRRNAPTWPTATQQRRNTGTTANTGGRNGTPTTSKPINHLHRNQDEEEHKAFIRIMKVRFSDITLAELYALHGAGFHVNMDFAQSVCQMILPETSFRIIREIHTNP